MTVDAQNEFLANVGLNVEPSQIYEKLLEKYFDITNDLYSNQAKTIENILNMATQNMKLVNGNISWFLDAVLTYYLSGVSTPELFRESK